MRRLSQMLGLALIWQMVTSEILSADSKSHSVRGVIPKTTITSVIAKPNLQLPTDTLVTRHSPKRSGGGTIGGSIRVLLGEFLFVTCI